MSASASDIARLRRLIAEPGTETYADADLAEAIERYPVPDSLHVTPDCDGWVPAYDLNAAAADLWEEKLSAITGTYDFQADGASYSESQRVEQYRDRVAYFRARRSATTIRLKKWPPENIPLSQES